jgi:small-conductance mechanosensitive channel
VRIRTQEFEKANRELSKRLLELEKWQKFSVTREERMVELKKRIKELERRLNEKERE